MTFAKTSLIIITAVLLVGCAPASPLPSYRYGKYEIWLEVAEVKCRLGKIDEAMSLIDDFDVALMVLHGEIACFTPSWLARERRSNARLPDRVFKDMCAKYSNHYGSVYGIEGLNPDFLEIFLAARRELERESAVLRRVCPRMGE